ncbi:YqaJ viral recombinase family protein [Alcanivorax sp. 1008]|uniref:YqaJ viral recombinase family protein n=1 Tax=Alcanivorax sp. 1008 TaxID=2816853 RepID=UPI001DE96B31|nr:YqaJ viral recombinase family protein [Alcanivorax sp. 1008]MCC1496702.1 hypothetical protein [Alcanivorax sp. 1008]
MSPLTAIRALPQARYIPHKRAEEWLQIVAREEPDRLLWHIDRLKGFGGSDIGSLVAAQRTARTGEHIHTFKSDRDIVRDKLLLNHPQRPVGPMLWGTLLEDDIEALSLHRFGATVDQEAIDAIESLAPDATHPWVRRNLDSIWRIGNARILIDYKAPGEIAHFFSQGAPLEYRCQLHQYAHEGKRAGVKFDAYALCVLDTPRRIPRLVNVRHDPGILSEVLDAGDFYWEEYVLAGKTPAAPDFLDEAVLLESSPELDMMVAEYGAWKALLTFAEQRAKTHSEQIKSYLQSRGFTDGHKVKTGPYSISARRKESIDRQGVLLLLQSAGISPTSFMLESGEFNEKAAFEKLVSLHAAGAIQADPQGMLLQDEIISLRPPHHQSKSVEAELYRAVRDVAGDLLIPSFEALCESLAPTPADDADIVNDHDIDNPELDSRESLGVSP